MKLAEISTSVFQLGLNNYPKGDYSPNYKTINGVLNLKVSQKHTRETVINYTPWTKFVTNADVAFANVGAFRTAVGSILSLAVPA